MKRSIQSYIVRASLILTAVTLTACSKTSFSGGGDPLSKAGALDASSELEQPAGDDASGGINQPSVDEFVEMLNSLPNEAEAIIEQNDCCMRHGQGHGIDVCVPGNKAGLASLSPIDIRGNQVCVPADTVAANPALFTGGTLGRCATR